MMPFFEASSQVAEWGELVEKFNFIAGKMVTRGYPVKLTSAAVRRSERQFRQNQQSSMTDEDLKRYGEAFPNMGRMARGTETEEK